MPVRAKGNALKVEAQARGLFPGVASAVFHPPPVWLGCRQMGQEAAVPRLCLGQLNMVLYCPPAVFPLALRVPKTGIKEKIFPRGSWKGALSVLSSAGLCDVHLTPLLPTFKHRGFLLWPGNDCHF